MSIDQEYLKALLTIFLESRRSFVELGDFEQKGIAIDDRFLFHIQLLEDQSLIERQNKEKDLGYRIALGGNFEWISKPLRLTASGHEFAEALNRKEVWEKLKTGFKDASDVTPDFSSVMLWSPISTRGDRTSEEALFGRADHRVSAGG